MDEGTIALTITTLGVFAVFMGLFIWGLKSGQFKDVEEPKYRMFELTEDDEDDKSKEEDADV